MAHRLENPERPFSIEEAHYTAAQREFVQGLLAGPRKNLPPNLHVWLNNLDFAVVAERFGRYVSQEAPFTKREKEIIILAVAGLTQSDFEKHFHRKLGLSAGLSEDDIARIENQQSVATLEPAESVVYELVLAMARPQQEVSQALYARAIAHLGHAKIADVVGLMGLYHMISWTVKFYALHIPQEVPA